MIGTTLPPGVLTQPQHSECAGPVIEFQVRSRLAECGYPQLARLHIRFDDGTVRLEGRVGSYYLKQVAQTAVMSMGEIARVYNAVVVVK